MISYGLWTWNSKDVYTILEVHNEVSVDEPFLYGRDHHLFPNAHLILMCSLWRCLRAGKVRKVPLEKRRALNSQVEVWYRERVQLVQVKPPEPPPSSLTDLQVLPCLQTSATHGPLSMLTSQFFPGDAIRKKLKSGDLHVTHCI